MTASERVVAPSALTCFVIGPIGNSLAEVGSPERDTYEDALRVMAEVIEPACQQVGLAPVRADSLARAGEITEQIFRRLRDDDVVIADLTGANANVMYELGLRHTRRKLTVQIGEYGRLPFDVNVIRTIQFSRSKIGMIDARNELAAVLEAGLLGDYDEITATRLWAEAETAAERPDEVESQAVQPDTEQDEPDAEEGFLDILARGEEQMEHLAPALEAVSAHIVEMGNLAEQSTEEMARSDAAGNGMRGRLQITARFATRLDAVADGLERDVARYETVLRDVAEAVDIMIKDLEDHPELLEEEHGLQLAKSLRVTAVLQRGSMSSLGGMVSSIRENARISRVLREPSNRLTAALDRYGAATSTIDDWDRRLQALGVPAPSPEELAELDSQLEADTPGLTDARTDGPDHAEEAASVDDAADAGANASAGEGSTPDERE